MNIQNKKAAFQTWLAHGPFKKGGSYRNVFTILAGTAIAQAIGILVTPILVRIYSPENFGTLATFAMLSNNLAMLSCLAYQGAIVLPRRNESGFILWISCLIFCGLVAAIVAINFSLFGETIGLRLGNPDIEPWLWLVAVSVFAWGGFEATAMWCTRLKRFHAISKGVVQRRVGTAGGQLGLGTIAASEAGLIIGQVFGQIAGLVAMARKAFIDIPQKYWRQITWKNIRVVLHRYRRFPQFSLLSSFSAALSRNMPVLCLGIYFNPATVGFFALAYKLLAAPMQLGIGSVTRVFFERANRAKRDKNLDQLTRRTFKSLMIIAMTPLILVCIASTDLVTLILGDRWEPSAVYLRWITMLLVFMIPTSALDKIFVIQERQHELAFINGLLLIVTTTGLVAGGMTGNPNTAVALFCSVATVVWILQCFRVLWLAGIRPGTGASILVREALQTLPYAVPMLVAVVTIDNRILITAIFTGLLGIFALLRAKHVLQAPKTA